MTKLLRVLPMALLAALIAGCGSRPLPAPAPLAVAPPPATAPALASTFVRVPPRLPDGSYATPNRTAASPAAALWHLRAGLNVAALGCRGADEAAIVTGYNALLAAHRAEFADAHRTLAFAYGQPAAFDAAMTGLYNYYALPPAQPGLCRAAMAILAEAAVLPPGPLTGFAPAALERLDAPYMAIFAAQDAWTATRFADRAPAAAIVASLAPQLVADRSVFSLP